jgi:anthranilate synthase component 1
MAVAAEPGLPVAPSLEEVRALAADYNLIPLRHTFIDDCETPVSAFLKLRGAEPSFLLESADQGQRVGRWSFIGFKPRAVVRWAPGDPGDPYELAARETARYRQAPIADGPPFAGGAVGLFAYDLVRTVEPLGPPNPDVIGLPDLALMLSDVLVAFDHLKHTTTVLANVYVEPGEDVEAAYGSAVAGIAEVRKRLAGPVPHADRHAARDMPEFRSNMKREEFEGIVARIVEYVHAGDAFQVVPSQRWSAPSPVEAFSIYRGLRAVNPSPYMYFLDFGDFEIAGASPEPLLTVTGREVSTRPVAGTRPRGASAAEDLALGEELLADEKERSEHVMLVDLGRNDLGRVSEYGSVEVDSFMAVETYSHVMHIVSSVRGTLRPEVGALDALRSVLPAGTLSGAPKVRAMQIIDELEPVKRGGYGGAIGWLSYSGDLDTCIHIRTVVVKDGVAHVQAGGGTVADAVPAYEFAESEAKARAVLKAVELATEQPDWP